MTGECVQRSFCHGDRSGELQKRHQNGIPSPQTLSQTSWFSPDETVNTKQNQDKMTKKINYLFGRDWRVNVKFLSVTKEQMDNSNAVDFSDFLPWNT